MAFTRKKVASYKWPVTVEIPADGGGFDKATFTIDFKKLGRTAFNDLIEQGDEALVNEIVQGWEDYVDETGKAIPCTKATKRELLDDHHVLRAVIAAYSESIVGAQIKN
jgi:hypothetical protein